MERAYPAVKASVSVHLFRLRACHDEILTCVNVVCSPRTYNKMLHLWLSVGPQAVIERDAQTAFMSAYFWGRVHDR